MPALDGPVHAGAACLLTGWIAIACGTARPAAELADRPSAAASPTASVAPAQPVPAQSWATRLIELGAGVEDEDALERFVGVAGQRFDERLLLEMSPTQGAEARAAIQMLIRLEWDPVLQGGEEFAEQQFRAALARAVIEGLVRLLAAHPPEIQLDRLRCALLDRQLRTLRRDALEAAKQRFDGALDAAAASARGMELALMVELLGAQERDLARSCEGDDLRAADLANSRLDVGFVVGGDPCDTLSWDVYIHIQGRDDLLPVTERTLGGDCQPKVLVLD